MCCVRWSFNDGEVYLEKNSQKGGTERLEGTESEEKQNGNRTKVD